MLLLLLIFLFLRFKRFKIKIFLFDYKALNAYFFFKLNNSFLNQLINLKNFYTNILILFFFSKLLCFILSFFQLINN